MALLHPLAEAITDFLHALDRGDFGPAPLAHDGEESAHVSALRDALDDYRAEHRIGPAAAGALGRAA